jgi:2'-5' RNA ligase
MAIKLFIGTSMDARLADEIRLRSVSLAGKGAWRWSPQQQWHVTTLFIGPRDEAEVQLISTSIERASVERGPITLHQGELVTMPQQSPSMLWVRFNPSEELTSLHHALAHTTSTPPSPHQPYWPHITLARGKGTISRTDTVLMVPSLTLRELTLFRSDPGPNGTVHTSLGTWPLGGPRN